MKSFRLLIGLYGKSLFGLNRMRYSDQKGSRIRYVLALVGISVLIVYVLAVLTAYCWMLGEGLSVVGQMDVIPVAMFAAGAVLSLFTSMARGGDMLLTFKDYDVQMSLPVKPATVALSRLAILYLGNLFVSLAVMLPAGGVYAWYVRPAFSFYFVYLLGTLLMPLLPAVVGSLLGALIARFSARFRSAKYMKILLVLLAVFAYTALVFGMDGEDPDAMANVMLHLSDVISRVYFPAKLFGRAVRGEGMSLVYLVLLSAVVFAPAAYVYVHNMRALHSGASETRSDTRFRMGRMSSSSILAALYKREFSRYFASVTYVINSAFGPLLGMVGAAALVFMGGETVNAFLGTFPLEAKTVVPAMACFMLCFMAGTCSTTASSVSLEGSAHWILQAIPVPAMTIMRAKILVNLTVLLPGMVVAAVLLAVFLQTNAMYTLLLLLMPVLAGVFTAELGLITNLKMHRFDWKNEAQIVKQSFPALVPMLAAMVYGLAPVFVCVFYPNCAEALALGLTLALAAGAVALHIVLSKTAEKALRSL